MRESIGGILTEDPAATRLLLETHLCKFGLRDFVERAWPILRPGVPFLPNWHIDLICEYLTAVTDGEIHRLIVNIPPRYMKPVDEQALVLMGDGSRKRLAEVKVGDLVISHLGRPCNVSAVHVQGVIPVLKITTDTGRVVSAAPDHPFLTPNGWVQAQDLCVGNTLALVVPEDIEPSSVTHEEFRLAGYFVGDGSCKIFMGKTQISTASTITCVDEIEGRDIQHCCVSMGFTCKLSTSRKVYNVSGGSRNWLSRVGLAGHGSHTKRVPKFVFEGSKEQIAHFIGAYFSCDGTLSKKHADGRALTISFASVNRALLCDVQHLLLRLGIRCRVRTKTVKYNSFVKGPHTSYLLELSTQDDTSKFVDRIPVYGVKYARLKAWGVKRTAFDARLIGDRIVSIEDDRDRACRCLTVDGDHSFLAEDIAVHNSILISIMWPAWEWIRFPWYRYLFVSYSKELSTEHSVDRRNLLQSNWYRERFGASFELTTDQNIKTSYTNNHQGMMVATSVGGTATGKGGNRVVMDGLQNPEQAESEVERETADRFFNRTLSTRLDNKIEGAFIAVMQRLHQADIAAKCIELGYTLVKIPAICPAKTIVTFPKSGVSFERPAGDILWPAREGPKEIREARIQLTPYGFASQYQQDPIPAGGQIFEVEKIKIVQAAPKHARRVRFWDKAGTEGGGAYSAGALLAKSQDGRIFVEDMVRGQWGPGTREQTIKQTTMLDSGRFGRNYRVYIEQEPGSSGKESNQLTIRRLHGVVAKSVVPERNVEGKVGRARPFATQVGVDNVYLVAAPWNKEFLEELRYFPNSTYKDQVDAASGAYMKLAKGRSSQSYDAI